jgi:hypothetical protein
MESARWGCRGFGYRYLNILIFKQVNFAVGRTVSAGR